MGISLRKEKQKALEKITREIKRCRECKKGKNGKAVPGEGSSQAEIVFVGEAPGREEAKTGRPFVGKSGQLLRMLIREIGLREKEVFITSPVKYLPRDGTPTKADIKHGRKHLEKQLAVIDPQIIVLLGKTAALALLEEEIPILKEHGKIFKKGKREHFLTFHPAAVVRFPKYRNFLLADFQKLQKILK